MVDIYLVGGAIRDRLLGRPVLERDYVVVNATTEQMLAQGFNQVGRDFPIFLHPETRAEYALTRTARTTLPFGPLPLTGEEVKNLLPLASSLSCQEEGKGGGALNPSLREDLQRRDLTINAMAETAQGQIIDYFGGLQDLQLRILRHVSPAFAEDPVRILRVARFMARYGNLGFQIAPETMAFMQTMVAANALAGIAPERIWRELDKSLSEECPALFFTTLRECGALAKILPELNCLWGIPQPSRWHPEIDTGVHTMLVLQMARRLSNDPAVAFAALTHDLGKGETPSIIWPSHRGHEERSVRLVEQVCKRLRVPNHYCELARLVARHHGNVHRAADLRSRTVLCILEETDAFRRPQRFEDMLLACEADFRGRTGFAESTYPQGARMRAWMQAATAVNSGAIAANCSSPGMIEQAITRARLHAIKGRRVLR